MFSPTQTQEWLRPKKRFSSKFNITEPLARQVIRVERETKSTAPSTATSPRLHAAPDAPPPPREPASHARASRGPARVGCSVYFAETAAIFRAAFESRPQVEVLVLSIAAAMALRADSLAPRRSLVPTRDRRAASLSPRRRLLSDGEPWTDAAMLKPSAVTRDELRCPICFDMLCFPVTLPCGHNFDRGCLLKAWQHDAPSDDHLAVVHACPLCRQRSCTTTEDDLHVNLLLKKLISAQFPVEVQGLESHEKCFATAVDELGARRPPSERRRHTWRTAASFFYVWLASVTEPPGFVLAVLLLLSLMAIAVTPQQMLTNATTLPTVFEALDHILNALLLLIREVGTRLDQLDQAWPWMQVFSFIL